MVPLTASSCEHLFKGSAHPIPALAGMGTNPQQQSICPHCVLHCMCACNACVLQCNCAPTAQSISNALLCTAASPVTVCAVSPGVAARESRHPEAVRERVRPPAH